MPSYYLVRSRRGVIYAKSPTEFTKDYTQALQFNTFGDAMKLAIAINEDLGTASFEVLSVG